jgi:hypothetical protein
MKNNYNLDVFFNKKKYHFHSKKSNTFSNPSLKKINRKNNFFNNEKTPNF